MSRKFCVLLLLGLAGCGTSKAPTQPSSGLSGNWVMKAQDANGATFQVTGVAQTTQIESATSQTIAMANLVGSSTHADPSCLPYTITLSHGNVNGSTFAGSFGIFSKNGERASMQVTGTISADGLSLSNGTYNLGGAPPSCFTAAAAGSFSGFQIPELTGTWAGTIQPCNWNPQTGACAASSFVGQITATLAQDDAAANVTGTYKISGSASFSSGILGMIGSNILSGPTLQVTLTDNNGANFVMDGQVGGSSLKGVVIDAASNHYSFQMLRQ